MTEFILVSLSQYHGGFQLGFWVYLFLLQFPQGSNAASISLPWRDPSRLSLSGGALPLPCFRDGGVRCKCRRAVPYKGDVTWQLTPKGCRSGEGFQDELHHDTDPQNEQTLMHTGFLGPPASQVYFYLQPIKSCSIKKGRNLPLFLQKSSIN